MGVLAPYGVWMSKSASGSTSRAYWVGEKFGCHIEGFGAMGLRYGAAGGLIVNRPRC